MLPRTRMLVTAKMNNTGESISDNTLDHIDVTDMDNYISLPENIIKTSSDVYLPIMQKRYLRNKSYSVGINHLRRIGRYGNLRTNITYYGTSDQLSDSTYNYYGAHRPCLLSESNKRKSTRRYPHDRTCATSLTLQRLILLTSFRGSCRIQTI